MLGSIYLVASGTKLMKILHCEVVAASGCSMCQEAVMRWTLPSWPYGHLIKHCEQWLEWTQKKKKYPNQPSEFPF